MLVKRNLQIVVCIFLRQNCRFTPAELWFNFTIPKYFIQNALWILKRNDKQLNGNDGCFRKNQEGSFLFCKVLHTDKKIMCAFYYTCLLYVPVKLIWMLWINSFVCRLYCFRFEADNTNTRIHGWFSCAALLLCWPSVYRHNIDLGVSEGKSMVQSISRWEIQRQTCAV